MMRLRRSAIRLIAAVPLTLALAAGAPPADDTRAVQAVAKVVPGVVNISVWRNVANTPSAEQRLPLPATRERSFGSGFVIDKSGILVTNKHVVEGADTITVGFEGERRYRARVLAAAISIDLALLKIDAGQPLPVVEFGDSDSLLVGAPVLAIGNPLSVGISVTSGVVSALNRDIHDTPFDEYVQTDASTNPGSSGGPLIDLDGKVIGINTAYLTGNGKGVGSIGIAFALPSVGAQFVIERLRRYGSVRAGWLGLQVQTVTAELAEAMALPNSAEEGALDGPPGLIVTNVDPGQPADRIGIAPGDVIYTLNGVGQHDPRALMRAIGRAEVGTAVTLEIWRAGRMLRQEATVEEWPAERAVAPPPAPVMARADPTLGLALEPLMQMTDGTAPPHDGAIVTSVADESVSMYGGVQPGDVIAKVMTQDISSPEQVFTAFAKARAEQRSFVTMLIRHGGVPQWTTLPVGSMGRRSE